jgi:5-methylcytosine-specific restriction endonuclease McrA
MSFKLLPKGGAESTSTNPKASTFRVCVLTSDRLDATERGKKGTAILKLIKRVLRRDKLCRICGFRVATIGDHIKRRVSVDDDTYDNLWGLCKRCHDIKTTLCDGGFGNTLSELTQEKIIEIRKRSLMVG